MLVAHGIRADGSRVLLLVVLGCRESTANWKDHLADLIRRGLRVPRLMIGDGIPGVLRAIFHAADETEARAMAAEFVEPWEREFLAMTWSLLRALDSRLTFCRFPSEHGPRIRASHILERCFEEVRRRTNLLGRLPTEELALALGGDGGGHGEVAWVKMARPTLRLIEAVAADLPKEMWAINHTGEEPLAA